MRLIVNLFEGVCFNSRHPGPRRVWKGGSEQQLMTPDLGDPLAAPDECQIVQKPRVFTAKVTRVTLWCNVFFLLFHTPLI